MEQLYSEYEEKMKKSLLSLQEEFKTLRTGRASANLLDRVRVECYGQLSPISQVATVSVPEARMLVISPWDKAMISEIEKAIQKADLGLNPSNDGKVIRISVPPLTDQRRNEIAKQAKTIAEKYRVVVRNIRRDGIDAAKKMQKGGTVSEDQLKSAETKFQNFTDKYIAEINKILEDKEKEIKEN